MEPLLDISYLDIACQEQLPIYIIQTVAMFQRFIPFDVMTSKI